MKIRVGFLVHRAVPAQRLRDAFRLLDRMGVGYDVKVASAGLDPGGVGRWVEAFSRGGGEILVAYDDAGGALGSLAAAYTMAPVISAPILGGAAAQGGVTLGALGKRGVPVAVVPGEHAADAAAFALRVLAVSDPALRESLERDHRAEIERLEAQGRQLHQQLEGLKDRGEAGRGRTGQEPARRGTPSDKSQERIPTSPADDEMVEQFARSLRPRLKTEHEAPPERTPALDYSLVMREVVAEARDLAARRPEGLIGPLHFLAAIARMSQAAAYKALRESGADLVRLRSRLEELMGPEMETPDAARTFAMGAAGEEMLTRARQSAREAERGCLTTADILVAIGESEDPRLGEALEGSGVDAERLLEILLRADIAGAECEELDASRQDRLPKTATPMAVDRETLEEMGKRLYGGRPERGGAPAEPEVIDIGDREEEFPVEGQPVHPAGSGSREEEKPRATQVIRINPENPDFEAVEEASDALLDGGVVAMATDTSIALMADATNPAAVERLRDTVGRAGGRPVTVLVHSAASVKGLARSVPEGVEELLDELWPGALTVVFERHPARFRGLGEEATIGIRSPDNYVTLAVLSMLGRPVAAVAAGSGEGGEEVGLREVLEHYGPDVRLAVDTQETPRRTRPTVLSVVGGEFRLLRSGPVSREQIEKVLGRSIPDSE